MTAQEYIDELPPRRGRKSRSISQASSTGSVMEVEDVFFESEDGGEDSLADGSSEDFEASNITDHLTYSSLNRPVRSYEQALTVFLAELDSVESLGDAGVRKSRKEAVERVEKALEELERDLEGRWKIRVSQFEPTTVGGAGLVPEIDLDATAEAKEGGGNEPAAVAGQEPTVESGDEVYAIPDSSPSLVNHGSPVGILSPPTSTTIMKRTDLELDTTIDIVEGVLDAIPIGILGFSPTTLPAASAASSLMVNDSVDMTITDPSESIVKRASSTPELHVADSSALAVGEVDGVRVENDVDEWV
ncbi:hypothetical protein H0H92_001027 [Tricholoma furcatifolium]|nr:hypothetical protein H0H92_001027 [Tricholoma furcatifolium]